VVEMADWKAENVLRDILEETGNVSVQGALLRSMLVLKQMKWSSNC
jgi:hypothetical protein